MRHNNDPRQISLFDSAEDRSVVNRDRKLRFRHTYEDIISIENLLTAWREFLRGKRKRKDVSKFSLHLMDNMIGLHQELATKTYQHGQYQAFKINDPKQRQIHKAGVPDRLVHHAIYRILYPYFDRKFIFDSYSCRRNKGTHRALNRLRQFVRKVSKNNTRTAWVLKCDIRKFFASIDHKILISILDRHLKDPDAVWLLKKVINSFHTDEAKGKGLPLGNLTSQLLVNIYLNELDQFVKRSLKAKYYIRYADDFVTLGNNKRRLENIIPLISSFLETKLKLKLHQKKLFIKTLNSGIDFLGWVHFPHHRVLRTSTKRRMFKKLAETRTKESLVSYLGLLSHGDTYKLVIKVIQMLGKRVETRRKKKKNTCAF